MCYRPSVSVTVLLTEDSAIMAQTIQRLLASRPEIDLIGQTGNIDDAIRLATALKPQVIVMDFHMARRDEDIKVLASISRLLLISLANDEETKKQAQALGAIRLLDKANLYDELVLAILGVTENSIPPK